MTYRLNRIIVFVNIIMVSYPAEVGNMLTVSRSFKYFITSDGWWNICINLMNMSVIWNDDIRLEYTMSAVVIAANWLLPYSTLVGHDRPMLRQIAWYRSGSDLVLWGNLMQQSTMSWTRNVWSRRSQFTVKLTAGIIGVQGSKRLWLYFKIWL